MADKRFTQKGKVWRDFADESEPEESGSEGEGSDHQEDLDDDEQEVGEEEEQSEDEDKSDDEDKLEEGEKKKKKKKKKKNGDLNQLTPSRSKSSSKQQAEEDEDELGQHEHGIRQDGYGDIDNSNGSAKKSKVGKEKKSALRKDALEYRDKLEQRGVLYMSRVPSKMKPDRCRALFQEHGEVTRIYMAEEDAASHRRRAASGGSTARHFTEGWVEYANKKIAKRVAASLNNTPISSRKGSSHVDERWNLKYLKKFKWDYLTEKLAYERRVREAKMKAAMLQAKRGNAEFAEWAEKNKGAKAAQERIEKKRKARGEEEGSSGGVASGGAAQKKCKRMFKQVRSLAITHGENNQLVGVNLLSKVWKKSD